MLRATKPTMAEVVLDMISLEYHETIMAPSGKAAEKSKKDVMKKYKGKYIAIVEGADPHEGRGGVLHDRRGIGPRTSSGRYAETPWPRWRWVPVPPGEGLPAPLPTHGCVGVKEAVPGATVVNLPGCPVNVENITATIVHFLTFGSLPALDGHLRPLFGYGKRIHDNCERRMHFDAGQFVRQWGDEGAPAGVVPVRDGLQGSRGLLQLSHGSVERGDELAGSGRASLFCLCGQQ